ncbi:hypothetical protein GCM10027614_80090 [Micromonospora vulcania]
MPGLADVLPLTPLQDGFYFHANTGDTDQYEVQQLVTLDGPVDAAALRRAVQAVLDRHAPLRAGFFELADGRVVQVIVDGVEVPWRVVDLPADDASAIEKELAGQRADGFDLEAPPLLRCLLVRHAEDRHTLVLTHHHIVTDGWSVAVFLRDLLAGYAPYGEPPRLAAVTPYRRYLEWLAGRDRGRRAMPGGRRWPASTSRPCSRSRRGAARRSDRSPSSCRTPSRPTCRRGSGNAASPSGPPCTASGVCCSAG